jgi:hypothetical protein
MSMRTAYVETAKAVTIGSIATCAWIGVKSLGISNCPTISPVAIGVASVAYSIFYKLSSCFFERIFNTDASEENYMQSHSYFLIQVASATAAVLTIHAIGLLAMTAYTLSTSLELLLFLKGLDFLQKHSQSLHNVIDRFVKDHLLPEEENIPSVETQALEPKDSISLRKEGDYSIEEVLAMNPIPIYPDSTTQPE